MVVGSSPGRVKAMTYIIDTWLVGRSSLIGYGKDWSCQYQDNVTEWDIEPWCWWPDRPGEQHYKVLINVDCHKLVPVLYIVTLIVP